MWWLLLLLPVCWSSTTNKFDLKTSEDPVSGWMGSSVTLPCILTPALQESLEVRWHRPNNYTTPVLLHQKQQIQQGTVDPRYQGRVSLTGELDKGNFSLSIENVTLADSGEFICFVSAVHQGYKEASVHLIVKETPPSLSMAKSSGNCLERQSKLWSPEGLGKYMWGSPPVLSLADGGSGQVNVTCVSEGWYPQPTLTWRNQGGTEIPSQSSHHATDAHGCMGVTSWLLYPSAKREWLSCSVGLSEEEREESRILPHFSCTYGGLWKDIVIGVLSVGFLLLIIYKVCVCGASEEKEEDEHPVVRIVLLGKTGVGKSATGNTILGRNKFKSEAKTSENKRQCEMQTETVHGRELYVIDTPAFFDTDAEGTDIGNQIKECISLASPGPHAFLAIYKVGPVTESEVKEMREKIQRFFGEDFSKYTIVLFTHGDNLASTIENFMAGNQELQTFVQQCGERYHVFKNKDRENQSQVPELLRKIDEMVKRNRGVYTIPETDEIQLHSLSFVSE